MIAFPTGTTGAAWPLDEDWFLCVYDPVGKANVEPALRYRLILLHAPTGLREVVYEDVSASCLTPIPLCARAMPPVIHDGSALFTGSSTNTKPATVSIVNVYNSHLPFPKGVKIAELRIVQILSKSTPLADQPHIGHSAQSLARQILGTVPVESDGSVYFIMPSAIPVYFQVLDEKGCAVQNMLSDTYAQPGERMSCAGCHESNQQTPSATMPCLAFKRPPSVIRPEPEGSYPFSYPRLIQPILDQHCVECHQKNVSKKAPDLSRGNYADDPNRWFASYKSLRPYVWIHGGDAGWADAMSVPGQLGALKSRLYPMLVKGHHEVKLSTEELRRISLWLDTNSNFLGAYENVDDQAAGKVVAPRLE